jgi:iron(III) transport system permease protein
MVPGLAALTESRLSNTAAAPSVPVRIDLSGLAFLALALALVILVVQPLAWLIYYAVTDNRWQFGLASFSRLAVDVSFLRAISASLQIAALVAVLSCVVATPLAWLVARTDMPFGRVIYAVVISSFVTPPFIGAIAWEILAAPNSGALNVLIRNVFGLEPGFAVFNIYSFWGVVFVMTNYAFPYVFVLVANALERVPGDMEEASAILGGHRFYTMRRVMLPMVLPAILAGAVYSFLHAFTQFGTPAILALPAGFHVVTTKIWSYFQYPPNPHLAAAAAVPILLLTALLLWLQNRLLGRRGFTVIGGKSGAERRTALDVWKWPALGLALVVVACPVILPDLMIVKMAFTRSLSGILSFDNVSLRNFYFVFGELSNTGLVLSNTLVTAALSATAGAALALGISYIVARKAVLGYQALNLLANAPAAVPGIVLGVGLFISYTRPPLQLYGTIWILLLAFVTIELPAAYQMLRSAFHGLHPELEEASRILGASRLKSLWRITAPLLAASLVATWCFIFIGAIRELSATILLTTASTKLVSVLIYDLNESGDLGSIAVLGLILMAATFVVVAAANRLSGGRKRSLRAT